VDRSKQEGTGASILSNSKFVEELAEVVSKKLRQSEPKQNLPITAFWRNYERSTPTVVSEIPQDTTPPLNFGVEVKETVLNDTYDEQALLKKIPKIFHKKATVLLKAFDERPNELTWDSTGNIYIDEKVIPNANIFILFPLLFKKTASKKHIGLDDFVAKLHAMKLSSLIKLKLKLPAEMKHLNTITPNSSNQNWWFLGE